jgi:trehalose/maltose transport system permease protein
LAPAVSAASKVCLFICSQVAAIRQPDKHHGIYRYYVLTRMAATEGRNWAFFLKREETLPNNVQPFALILISWNRQGMASTARGGQLERGEKEERRNRRYLTGRQVRLAWLLIIPTLLVLLLIVGYPMAEALVLTFQKAKLDGSIPSTFIGIDNYLRLLRDPEFLGSIWNSLRFTFIAVPIEGVVGVLFALAANSAFKGRRILRFAILAPWAVPSVATAEIWRWMFHDVYGLINYVLISFGKQFHLQFFAAGIPWLALPQTAMGAIVAVDVWRSSPYVAIILLAGLQLVPRELYDAATIDGATSWKRFWHITLPILTPTLLVALILRTVDAFRIFDLVAVMTEGDADTATAVFYNKQVLIDFNNAGLGSTVSVLILLISLSFVFLYSRLLKRSFR